MISVTKTTSSLPRLDAVKQLGANAIARLTRQCDASLAIGRHRPQVRRERRRKSTRRTCGDQPGQGVTARPEVGGVLTGS